MDSLNIMPTKREDLDEILAIEHRVFPDPWTRLMFADQLDLPKLYTFVSARLGDELVGYAGFLKIKDEGHITNMAVKPERHSRGIGKSLIYFLLLLAQKEVIDSIMLEVRTINNTAQELYKKFGFETLSVRENYYGYEDDAYVMVLRNTNTPRFSKRLEEIRKSLKYNIEDFVNIAS